LERDSEVAAKERIQMANEPLNDGRLSLQRKMKMKGILVATVTVINGTLVSIAAMKIATSTAISP
jgi:hypothetical protein